MIRQKWVLRLIEQVAKEENLPTFVVEEVFNSQFKFLKETISKSKECEDGVIPPTIMLPYWGKYHPSLRKLKYIKTRNEARKQQEKNSNLSETP